MSGIIYICFLNNPDKDPKIIIENVKKYADVKEIVAIMDVNTDSALLHELSEPVYVVQDQKVPMKNYSTSYDGFLNIINNRLSRYSGCKAVIDISTATNIQSFHSCSLSMILSSVTIYVDSENQMQNVLPIPLPNKNKIRATKVRILGLMYGGEIYTVKELCNDFTNRVSNKTIGTNVNELEEMNLIECCGYKDIQHHTGPKSKKYVISDRGKLTYDVYFRNDNQS